MTNPPWGPPDPPQQPWGQQPPQQPWGQQPPQQPQQPWNPQYGPPQPPPRKNNTGLWAGIGAVVVIGIVLVVLGVTGVFGGDDDDKSASTGSSATASGTATDTASSAESSGSVDIGSGTAAAAVRTVFDGIVAHDTSKVSGALCRQDQDKAAELTAEHVKSYTITRTKQIDAEHANVYLTVEYTDDDPDTPDVPVIKEDGDWKMCLSADPSYGSGGGPQATDSVPTDAGSLPTEPSFEEPSLDLSLRGTSGP